MLCLTVPRTQLQELPSLPTVVGTRANLSSTCVCISKKPVLCTARLFGQVVSLANTAQTGFEFSLAHSTGHRASCRTWVAQPPGRSSACVRLPLGTAPSLRNVWGQWMKLGAVTLKKTREISVALGSQSETFFFSTWESVRLSSDRWDYNSL